MNSVIKKKYVCVFLFYLVLKLIYFGTFSLVSHVFFFYFYNRLYRKPFRYLKKINLCIQLCIQIINFINYFITLKYV